MRFPSLSKSLVLLSVLAPWLAHAAEHSDVINLTPSNFDSTVNPEDLILVEFFAPWCGHCKALAPHYEESATALKEKGIKLAKVDCVDNADLCNQQGVSGYPTLKVFRKGVPTEYNGPRKADGIISYMTKQALPAVSDVTASNHEEFKKADKIVVVAYLSSPTQAPGPIFSQVAEQNRDDYLFGLSTDSAVFSQAGVQPPAVVIYKQFDDGRTDIASSELKSITADDLTAKIIEESIPLFGEVGPDNYATYAQSGLPLAYLFVDPTDEKNEELIKSLKPIAAQYKGKINFVHIDAVKFVEHAKSLSLGEPNWPAFVIQDLDAQTKFPLEQSEEVSYPVLNAFVKSFSNGELEPKLKSEPIPESQEEAVFTLVGSQFEEVVFDDSKDVLVEFYAPWCGHCKRLKPTWDSLAERYTDVKDRLVIAKMDATENDLPPSVPFRISGFPTIKFKPAGSKSFVDYDGDRSLESLIEFVEQKAKNSLVPEADPSGSAKITTPSEVPFEHDEL